MGISCSCPFAEYNDLENGFEAVIVKSISFDGDSVKTALRSISFNGRDSEPAILKSLSSGRMILEGSVSFKSRELQTMISIKAPSSNEEKNVIVKSISFNSREIDNPFVSSDGFTEKIPQVPLLDPSHPKHEAALKLQKVYKSFRTRRKLADCAVLVEQRWWKLLDFVELKRSSISFFDIEKHETAVSRWSRARTRAAKVGKGLSKDNKAQKLALQHWLEAIDPRHRYGHNLHFYYVKWLHCESRQPFFYWLDIGEGKEVNLDRCPRSRLQQQCIKYLGPTERKEYEVTVENGKFLYKQTGELLNTCGGSKDAKWIFVLSTTKTLYVGQKNKGKFQHSSFLAGGATSAAGRLVVENGMLKAVWPHSGHYRPTEENFQEFVTFLKDHDVDLTDVKKNPTDEEEESLSKHGSTSLRINFSEQNLTQEMTDLVTEGPNTEDFIQERTDSMEQDNIVPPEQPKSRLSRGLDIKLSNLAIPKRTNAFETSDGECLSFGPSCSGFFAESPHDGYETPEESFSPKENYIVSKRNMFEEDQVESVEEIVPQESILHRISSHKRMESYQLGKQLSFKWTTGAGPRIGCVRDYPSELQFLALEQVNLSPRKSGNSRGSPQSIMGLSPKVSTPTPLSRETTAFTKTNLR